MEETIIFDTELGFIFGGVYAANKLFPLFITIFGCVVAFLFLKAWKKIIMISTFRSVYEFVNQKWHFDLVYFAFIISPIMNFSYRTTFKLIDRGVLEFVGGTNLYANLGILVRTLNFYESGHLYSYVFIQLLSIVALGVIIF